MKTLAKVLNKGGKTNTKLYESYQHDFRANTSIDVDTLAKEITNLTSREKRQLASMKFEDKTIQEVVNSAMNTTKKAPVQRAHVSGERY